MRRATLPAPLRLSEAAHGLRPPITRHTLGHVPYTTAGNSPGIPITPPHATSLLASYGTTRAVWKSPLESAFVPPRTPPVNLVNFGSGNGTNSIKLAKTEAIAQSDDVHLPVAVRSNAAVALVSQAATAVDVPPAVAPRAPPISNPRRNPLQVELGRNIHPPRRGPVTALGEPIEDVWGPDAARMIQEALRRSLEAGNTEDSIDHYIAMARIGEENRRHLSERDPWLESLLLVKQSMDGMEEALRDLRAGCNLYPGLNPLVEDLISSIQALQTQTIQFYSQPYDKWWGRVPAPPQVASQANIVGRMLTLGDTASATAAKFLYALLGRVADEHVVFSDMDHPRHAEPVSSRRTHFIYPLAPSPNTLHTT